MKNLVAYFFINKQVIPIDLALVSKRIERDGFYIGSENISDIVIQGSIFNTMHLLVTNDNGRWMIQDLSGDKLLLPGKERTESLELKNGTTFLTGKDDRCLVILYEKSLFENLTQEYNISDVDEITIANHNDADVQILLKGIFHFKIVVAKNLDKNYYIKELEGNIASIQNTLVFINQIIKHNEPICILGIQISFSHDSVRINRVEDIVRVNNFNQITAFEYDPFIPFSRGPREILPIPGGVLKIQTPDTKMETEIVSDILSIISPLSYAGGMVLLFVMVRYFIPSQNMNPFYFIGFSVVSILNAIILYFFTVRLNKRRILNKQKKRAEEYRQYLLELETYCLEQHEAQRKALLSFHPSVLDCIEHMPEQNGRMWEKLPIHRDFLEGRIGRGKDFYAQKIEFEANPLQLKKDELLREALKLKEKVELVEEVPIVLDFKKHFCVGLCGPKELVLGNLFGLIVHLSYQHAYTDLRFVFILSKEEQNLFGWVRWLPHTWDERRYFRMVLSDEKQDENILFELFNVLKKREEEKKATHLEQRLPHYLFFISNQAFLEGKRICKYLRDYQNPELGFSSIFIEEEFKKLPPNCKTVIKYREQESEIVATENIDNTKLFLPDVLGQSLESTVRTASAFSYLMAPYRISEIDTATAIPETITFLEMYGVEWIEDLRIMHRWAENHSFKGISVPIGMSDSNKLLTLDLSEKGHGPHGLIAGMTGSGKSEFIQSLILSLAVNFSPKDVAFLFVDFKGGATANIFQDIPHNLGILTNIEDDNLYQINRAIISLKKEIEERQIFLQKPYDNIDLYQKAYLNGFVEEYIPHLFIIVDEFAELKNDFPDFIDQLISISRIGRSLGIHLILATQKPAGVVNNQIWSNSRFRICLKVQDKADSMEVITKPNAADIKRVGQAYIQVGNNELFELFQSAYSGAKYNFENSTLNEFEILEVSLNGTISPIDFEGREPKYADTTQIHALVKNIAQIAMDKFVVKKIWHESLKKDYVLDGIMGFEDLLNEKTWFEPAKKLTPVIGMGDDIHFKRQRPQVLTVHSGHTLIVGGPSSGKTNLIYTMITSLIRNYGPAALSLYIVDLTSQNMENFGEAPQVGGVVNADETEKFRRLYNLVREELQLRKTLFSKHSCMGWEQYRNLMAHKGTSSVEQLSNFVVVIDNFAKVRELMPNFDDAISSLLSECAGYGIFFVISATSYGHLGVRLSHLFSNKIVLNMPDKAIYREIFGSSIPIYPAANAGRGLVLLKDEKILEFQTALFSVGAMESDRIEHLILTISKMKRMTEVRAKRIPVLPEIVTMEFVYTMLKQGNGSKVFLKKGFIPIGVLHESVEPFFLNMNEISSLLISGKSKSGKTTVLKNMLNFLTLQYKEGGMEFYILDESGSMEEYKNHEMVVNYMNGSKEKEFEAFIDHMVENVSFSKYPMRVVVMDNFIEGLSNQVKSNNYEFYDKLTSLIKMGNKGNVKFLLASNHVAIKSNMGQNYVRQLMENKTGIAIGGNLGDHGFDSSFLPYEERNKNLEKWEAYYFDNEKLSKIKLLK